MDSSLPEDNDPEKFVFTEISLVSSLMQLLDDVSNSMQQQESGKKGDKDKKLFLPPKIDEDEFIVTRESKKRQYTDELKKSKKGSDKTSGVGRADVPFEKFTFVNQIGCDPELRAKVRQERERIAQTFRTQANYEYRQLRYKDALFLYTKAIAVVDDTPVLYCNRGLCHAKLGNYDHALLDFDLVTSKIDQNCMQAWLYRAACLQRMGNEAKFNESIRMAIHYNPEKEYLVTEFLIKLKSGNF